MGAGPFNKILVPVDFAGTTDDLVASGLHVELGEMKIEYASASARSLEVAAGLAGGGELRLLHATPAMDTGRHYGAAAKVGMLSSAIEEIHREARKAALEVLEHLAERYCKGAKVSFESRPGPPLPLILKEAEAFGADLIVMPASGRSRVARFFLGSTADRVIREAGCPVLVIPPDGD
jgi:nucleotide-binding universal stress UspA family protein